MIFFKRKETPPLRKKKTYKIKLMICLNSNARHASIHNIQPFHTIYNMIALNNNLTYYFIATKLGDNTYSFCGDGICNDLYQREHYLLLNI